jgi:predicted porin
MKKFVSLIASLAFAGSTFAQMSGYSSSQSIGTTLGANETLTADGIALGNAVKLRGYVDFVFGYDDEDKSHQNEQFDTSADVDFLFDLSPITAELHLAAQSDAGSEDIALEQAFGRYSVNDDFHVTFGRQLTVLGFEADEAPGLYAVTTAHVLGNGDNTNISVLDVQTRRNYVDGVRLNYNNGMFGLTFGLHDGYWKSDHFDGDDIAIDIAASVMFFPGLEARLGYAYESVDGMTEATATTPKYDGDIGQFNAWLSYQIGDLLLATEFDNFSIDPGVADSGIDYFSWMLMANYQFTDWFAATLRYTLEDIEDDSLRGAGSYDWSSDRITFAFLFSITNNFGLNVEYSTTGVDSSQSAIAVGKEQGDYDEFLIEGIITY